VVLEQDTAYEPYSVRETSEEAIGAEVEHGRKQKRNCSVDSAVKGLRGGLLRKAGYRHGAALDLARKNYSSGERESLFA
jgi:hypothetical protein